MVVLFNNRFKTQGIYLIKMACRFVVKCSFFIFLVCLMKRQIGVFILQIVVVCIYTGRASSEKLCMLMAW